MSATVSFELAKPLVPYGPAMMESFLLFVDPASYESGQPSLSESRSRWFGMPSPSLSIVPLQYEEATGAK